VLLFAVRDVMFTRDSTGGVTVRTRTFVPERNQNSAPASLTPGSQSAPPDRLDPADARDAVTELYEALALGLIRLAFVMLGDRPAAEAVVQEAFCGLYRRWHALSDTTSALAYVRSSVISGNQFTPLPLSAAASEASVSGTW
jgi:hypothetical protein